MKSSLEQFIKAAEIFPVAILIVDADGRIVLVNGRTDPMEMERYGFLKSTRAG